MPRLSEEEVALLESSDVDEDPDAERPDVLGFPGPPGYRERLVLGDISW